MHHARTFLIAALASALAGCAGDSLNDPSYPTGSSVMAASSSGDALIVANPDQGTLSRIDLDDESVAELQVGQEPTRLARVGDRFVVALRAERALAVVDEETFTVETVIPTGAEPFGVVSREDGKRFYVTVSQDGTVQEYDGETLELLRTFEVGVDVRWMALHPSNQGLYVASPFGGELYWIDVPSGDVTLVEIPAVVGRHPETGDDVPLTPRITGDLAISPDGRQLAVPMLHVENTAPNGDLSAPNPGAAVYYAPPGGGRFNSTVLTTSVIGGGLPADEFWEATLLNVRHGSLGTVASYPSSVTWSPDGEQLLLTVEAGEAVLSVPGQSARTAPVPGVASNRRNVDGLLLLQVRPSAASRTSSGPRGLAFVDDEAYVYSYFDGLVEKARADRLRESYEEDPSGSTPSTVIARAVVDAPVFSDFVLSADERAGRELFYTSTDRRMAFQGSGVSCSTCHIDGRNDGLTWPLEDGGRQTPSLAGGVTGTEPVTWTLGVPSAADEAFLTSQGRMGGVGLTVDESEQIAAFISTFRAVDQSTRGLDEAAISRGAEAFVQAGCDECHSGALHTDNASYEMLGLTAVNTPPLTGIASTAPYFHDGSAATLRDVLEFSRSGEMGDTSSLSEAQMQDLEAYLRSL